MKEQEASLVEAPTAEELTEMHAVAEDIRHMIESGRLTEEMKREVLQDLAVRIEIGADGKATVKGVFKPFEIRILSKSYL